MRSNWHVERIRERTDLSELEEATTLLQVGGQYIDRLFGDIRLEPLDACQVLASQNAGRRALGHRPVGFRAIRFHGKFPSTTVHETSVIRRSGLLAGHRQSILSHTGATVQIGYEGEPAAVIDKRARHVAPERTLESKPPEEQHPSHTVSNFPAVLDRDTPGKSCSRVTVVPL